MRRLGHALLGLMLWGVVVALEAQAQATPYVAVSTRAVPTTRDSLDVVVGWGSRCLASGCPVQYRVAVASTHSRVGSDVVFGRTVATTSTIVRVPRPICPAATYVQSAVVAIAGTGAVSRTGVSLRQAVPCRSLHAAEVAFLDSFPSTHRRFVMCSPWARKLPAASRASWQAMDLKEATTASDSIVRRKEWELIAAGPDSVYTEQPASGFVLTKGYQHGLTMLGKNRYTQRAREVAGFEMRVKPPDAAYLARGRADCAAAAARWDAERAM